MKPSKQLVVRIAALAIVCLFVWAPLAAQAVEKLNWMAGCWLGSSGTRQFAEHWMKPAGGTLLGMSRTLAGGRTVAYEFLRIEEHEGQVTLVARPSGQPEASFKMIQSSATEVIFENPEHDFPQRVIYRLQPDGSLVGRIEGLSKGKPRAIDFPMKRVPCE